MFAPDRSFPKRRLSLLAPLLLLLAAGAPGDARAAAPTMAGASALYEKGEWKPAAEAYAAITKADPKNGLDFWIGDWEVTRTSDGTLAGTNRITLENGDCVLYEHWTSARYRSGQSMNYHDPVTKRWHQSWVDDQGEVSIFDGEFRDGAMRLEGYRQGTDGARIPARLTLTPMPDGSVRQLGENSEDGGKTWTTMYDLTYRWKK